MEIPKQRATAPTSPRRGLNAFRSDLERAGANVLPAGARVGECEIVGLIGAGDYSIVYLAYDYSLERNVALKEYMPASLAMREQDGRVTPRPQADEHTFNMALGSFLSEARLLARFDSPSLVKIFRSWEANGTAYMAMPYYEGITLAQAAATGGVDTDEKSLRALMEPLFDAVEALHAAHCQHPDIAPDNILLLADGRPLLLDFGAARRVISAQAHGAAAATRPGFAPIEEYDDIPNLKQGPWTDVYALAAVVYFLITGKAPPPAASRLAADAMTPARQAGAGRYGDAFLAALDQALAVRPQQRIQSIAQFRRALAAKAGAAPVAAATAADMSTIRSPETNPDPAIPPAAATGAMMPLARTWLHNMQSRPAMAAAVLAGLVFLVAAGLWGVQRPDSAAVATKPAGQSTAVMDRTENIPAGADKPAARSERAAGSPPSAREDARWSLASTLNNAAAYESYLAEYPGGRFAATARAALERIRAGEPAPTPLGESGTDEEALWNAVRNIDKPLVYESFLGKYPNSRHASAARASLARLRTPPAEPPRAAVEPPRAAAEPLPREPAPARPEVAAETRAAQKPAPAASASAAAASAPPAQDRVAALRPTEPPAAPARAPQEAEAAAEAEPESLPAPVPARERRTLRLPNQTMVGDFSPDPVTGLISGRGQIIWDNGDRFEGTMVRGQKEGKGEFRWSSGQRYRGDWLRDQPHGSGTIHYPNGDRYTGAMRGGLPNGTGTLVFSNGNRYQGEVRDGLPNGAGTIAFANGNRYRGEVRDGLPHGTGVNRFSNGDTYSGAWRAGKSHGQGRYTWANGNYWEGEFSNDVKTENGKMEYAAGAAGGGDRQ
ncbi:MAG: protein kinase [Noviherbaspirillum sp.]